VTRNLVLGLMVAALVLLAGGAALAATITCTGGECRGTAEDDKITGTGGNDQIFGLRGRDQITGDPFGSKAGNDELRGGGGNDFIVDTQTGLDLDTVFGGNGDDRISVREGGNIGIGADTVDCGPGTDTVFFDEGTDTVTNCEITNP
jgi:Ca2+-binding RTX toxin-like protein